MSLELLKQAMEAAKTALEASPEDQALKDALATATAAYEAKLAEGAGEDDEDLDESKFDEKTKKYIAKLRKENGSHRTKAKDLASKVKTEQDRVKAILLAAGIESNDDKPEEKIKNLDSQNSTLAFRNAILESAVQNGIPADQVEYFEFLVTKATNELADGEELPDDKLKEIVLKTKKASAGKPANSTTNGGGGNPPPKPGSNDTITLAKFCSMSMMEKSKLYETNKDLYLTLATEARAKKKLV